MTFHGYLFRDVVSAYQAYLSKPNPHLRRSRSCYQVALSVRLGEQGTSAGLKMYVEEKGHTRTLQGLLHVIKRLVSIRQERLNMAPRTRVFSRKPSKNYIDCLETHSQLYSTASNIAVAGFGPDSAPATRTIPHPFVSKTTRRLGRLAPRARDWRARD